MGRFREGREKLGPEAEDKRPGGWGRGRAPETLSWGSYMPTSPKEEEGREEGGRRGGRREGGTKEIV